MGFMVFLKNVTILLPLIDFPAYPLAVYVVQWNAEVATQEELAPVRDVLASRYNNVLFASFHLNAHGNLVEHSWLLFFNNQVSIKRH